MTLPVSVTTQQSKLSAPTDPFEYLRQQYDRIRFEKNYDWTKDKGWQPQSTPQSNKDATETMKGGISVVFQGTNVIDENSMDLFVRKVSEVQKQQSSGFFAAG